jgi:hypothetical protein
MVASSKACPVERDVDVGEQAIRESDAIRENMTVRIFMATPFSSIERGKKQLF